MAQKYTNMVNNNLYPALFSNSLSFSIEGTKKTPMCKLMKVLLNILKSYKDKNNALIFPYIELINSLLENNKYRNGLISRDVLNNHYTKTSFYKNYNQHFHKNIITEKLSQKKSYFLLQFLNSQIKI